MYLKKLYSTNKWWFAGITLFILLQLFINVKQGVVVSPAYHFGMYSAVIPPQPNYTVTSIAVNGELLQTKDFTPAEWDKINLTLERFNNQQAWNSTQWNTDIKRLLHLTDSSKYINTVTNNAFNTWYKNYLQTILNKKVDSVTVAFTDYIYNGQHLIPKHN